MSENVEYKSIKPQKCIPYVYTENGKEVVDFQIDLTDLPDFIEDKALEIIKDNVELYSVLGENAEEQCKTLTFKDYTEKFGGTFGVNVTHKNGVYTLVENKDKGEPRSLYYADIEECKHYLDYQLNIDTIKNIMNYCDIYFEIKKQEEDIKQKKAEYGFEDAVPIEETELDKDEDERDDR